jgi:hypothetical protein
MITQAKLLSSGGQPGALAGRTLFGIAKRVKSDV